MLDTFTSIMGQGRDWRGCGVLLERAHANRARGYGAIGVVQFHANRAGRDWRDKIAPGAIGVNGARLIAPRDWRVTYIFRDRIR